MMVWKKKPTAADCRQFMYNETEWPGKKPKAPKTLKGCLIDLIKDSTSWLRKYPDVWFPRYEKAFIVEARGAAKSGDELIELYDEAIAVVQWVARCAHLAEEKACAEQDARTEETGADEGQGAVRLTQIGQVRGRPTSCVCRKLERTNHVPNDATQ